MSSAWPSSKSYDINTGHRTKPVTIQQSYLLLCLQASYVKVRSDSPLCVSSVYLIMYMYLATLRFHQQIWSGHLPGEEPIGLWAGAACKAVSWHQPACANWACSGWVSGWKPPNADNQYLHLEPGPFWPIKVCYDDNRYQLNIWQMWFYLGPTQIESSLYRSHSQIGKDQCRKMHPLEALSSHMLPVTKKMETICGAPQLVTDDIPQGHLRTMAGNAMNTPSVGAFMLAIVLCLERIPKTCWIPWCLQFSFLDDGWGVSYHGWHGFNLSLRNWAWKTLGGYHATLGK